MKLHKIYRTQMLPVDVREAWNFFADPRNLADITPDWMQFRITSDVPDQMYAGLIITYRISVFPGIALRWITEITHLQPGNMFVDEQRFGPYRFWHHQHLFRETTHGTSMEDIVHYAMPLNILGELVHRIAVRRRLDEIFQFREKALKERFTSPQ